MVFKRRRSYRRRPVRLRRRRLSFHRRKRTTKLRRFVKKTIQYSKEVKHVTPDVYNLASTWTEGIGDIVNWHCHRFIPYIPRPQFSNSELMRASERNSRKVKVIRVGIRMSVNRGYTSEATAFPTGRFRIIVFFPYYDMPDSAVTGWNEIDFDPQRLFTADGQEYQNTTNDGDSSRRRYLAFVDKARHKVLFDRCVNLGTSTSFDETNDVSIPDKSGPTTKLFTLWFPLKWNWTMKENFAIDPTNDFGNDSILESNKAIYVACLNNDNALNITTTFRMLVKYSFVDKV